LTGVFCTVGGTLVSDELIHEFILCYQRWTDSWVNILYYQWWTDSRVYFVLSAMNWFMSLFCVISDELMSLFCVISDELIHNLVFCDLLVMNQLATVLWFRSDGIICICYVINYRTDYWFISEELNHDCFLICTNSKPIIGDSFHNPTKILTE
jgi:hypothetical protein